MTECSRPAQDQARQNLRMKRGGGQEVPPLRSYRQLMTTRKFSHFSSGIQRLSGFLCSSRWLHTHACAHAGIRKWTTMFNENTKDAYEAGRERCTEVKDGEGIGEEEKV